MARPSSPFGTLPSPRSTRILKLNAVNEQLNRLYGDLIVVDLDEPTHQYIALSYTWGPAVTYDTQFFTPKHGSHGIFDLELPEFRLAANDSSNDTRTATSSIRLTQNLSDFFRHHHQKIVNQKILLWIDAICIDQQDSTEVSSQIFQMDAIFESAEFVWVWLGPEFENAYLVELLESQIFPATDRLRARFKDGGKTSEELYSWLTAFSPFDDSFWRDEMGVAFPPKTAWQDIWADYVMFFCTRRWFSRVWVIQEAVLARSLILVVGDHFFDWDSVYALESLLLETGWMPTIEMSETLSKYHSYGAKEGNRKGILGLHTYYRGRIHRVAVVTDTEISGPTIIPQPWTVTFTWLLDAVSSYETSSAADYVNGVIGLAKRLLPTPGQALLEHAPSRSASVTFTWTCSTLAKQGSLMFLSLVRDRADNITPGLSSWTVDWAAHYHDRALQRTAFEASGSVKLLSTAHAPLVDGKTLFVAGIKVNSVDGIFSAGTLPNEYSANAVDESSVLLWTLLHLRSRLGATYSRSGEVFEDALRRTIMLDHSLIGPNYVVAPPGHCEQGFNDYLAHLLHKNDSPELFESFRSLRSVRAEHKAQAAKSTLVDLSTQAENSTVEIELTSETKEFRTVLAQQTHKRKFCTTASGDFGLCLKSAAIGDEVWLIKGHRSPVLLRPHKSKDGFIFMGDAYIHGIMYGELMSEELEASFRRIALI